MDISHYQSPLSERYASPEMGLVFSKANRASIYRRLWTELAKAQKELGLDISKEQIQELEDAIFSTSFETVDTFEKKLHHDVMAHIHAYGLQCPKAAKIIHLGATSTFVTDNADLIQFKEGLVLLRSKMLVLINTLKDFSLKYKDLPCLGYTHLQPAQPITVGKRAALWLSDFLQDFVEIDHVIHELPFLGVKGATGTQASFLTLFDGNKKKVHKLDEKLAKVFHFHKLNKLASQTYSRKIDIQILNAFESFAASAHKFATDIRLLSSKKEIQEGFITESQVGSSAMPYKQNPIRSERICSLSRFLISLAQNPAYTHATQWLERSLDDSANRRLSLSESFLTADAVITLLIYVIQHLSVHEMTIESNLSHELPFLMIETLIMLGVKEGKSRQDLHEKYRQLAHAYSGCPEKMLESLYMEADLSISKNEIEKHTDISQLIGLASDQVEQFIKDEVDPILLKENIKEYNPSVL